MTYAPERQINTESGNNMRYATKPERIWVANGKANQEVPSL